MSSMSNCFNFSFELPFPTDSPCAPLLVVDPGVNGVALESMVWVTGISRGAGVDFGEARGDGDECGDPDRFGD